MKKNQKRIWISLLGVLVVLQVTGCTTMQKSGAIGAGLGAGIGQLAYSTANATLWGAGIGAVLGIITTEEFWDPKVDHGRTKCRKYTERLYDPYTGMVMFETVKERCTGTITYNHY